MDSPNCLDGRTAWLDNGRCRYHEAMVAAERGAAYPDELGFATWSIVELIEAAVRSGRREKATGAFEQLCATTRTCRSDLALGLEARCRALIEAGDTEVFYLEAIKRLGRTGVLVELARARLLYGEWLRRQGRRIEARAELRAAHETFLAMGIDGFAQRTLQELLATGETVRKRNVETFADLTPQEAAIARLAGSGHTNPEIGTQLYLSPRTVEWHLRKVFAKLNVTSRRQLRQSLPTTGVERTLALA
jgi:DNA-binding CsgD family transcriptional regulator